MAVMPETVKTAGKIFHGQPPIVFESAKHHLRGAGKDKVKDVFELFLVIIGKLLLPVVHNAVPDRKAKAFFHLRVAVFAHQDLADIAIFKNTGNHKVETYYSESAISWEECKSLKKELATFKNCDVLGENKDNFVIQAHSLFNLYIPSFSSRLTFL